MEQFCCLEAEENSCPYMTMQEEWAKCMSQMKSAGFNQKYGQTTDHKNSEGGAIKNQEIYLVKLKFRAETTKGCKGCTKVAYPNRDMKIILKYSSSKR